MAELGLFKTTLTLQIVTHTKRPEKTVVLESKYMDLDEARELARKWRELHPTIAITWQPNPVEL